MNRIFFYVSDSYNVILFVLIILPLFPLGLLAALASLTSGSSGGNNSTSPSGNSSGNGSSAAGTFPSLLFPLSRYYIVCLLFIICMASSIFIYYFSCLHVVIIISFSQFMAFTIHSLFLETA